MRGVIVVAGEALVDLVVTNDGIVAKLGGAPYNVARGCARLGEPTALMASVSDDGFGRELAADLASSGVVDELLQRTGLPTTLAVAEVDERGAATYRFYTAGTSAPSLTPEVLPAAATMLVTGGLGLVLQPMAATIEAVGRDAGADVLVLVDVNCRPTIIADRPAYMARLARVLPRADVVKVSDEDLAYLRPGVALPTAAAELVDAGARVVLVTTGGSATTIVTASTSVTVPVAAVPVIDTIGAGDAFTAGFAAWWHAHERSRDDLARIAAVTAAVRAAHAVAAVVVGRRGADPPRGDELPVDWAPDPPSGSTDEA